MGKNFLTFSFYGPRKVLETLVAELRSPLALSVYQLVGGFSHYLQGFIQGFLPSTVLPVIVVSEVDTCLIIFGTVFGADDASRKCAQFHSLPPNRPR